MVNTLLNNTLTHQQHNVFLRQSKHPKNQNRKTARAGDSRKVWQDKGHFQNAPHKAGQPAPFSKGSGARALSIKTTQVQKTKTGRTKLI
ncbi:MAG TPA: hypothetical protein VES69_13335, partial [Pyrinomonadaceae bacterium]|nr:hypothetical protein [Pyrinomonadaceae bacterium]